MVQASTRQTFGRLFGRFAAMTVVTIFAGAVMVASGTRGFNPFQAAAPVESPQTPPTSRPRIPVSVQVTQQGRTEILDSYSGMIRPLERYSLAFEISGRIESLGLNEAGQELDEGDRVRQGQVLAVLDRRMLEARLAEAQARYEQKADDLRRSEELQERNPVGVSGSQLALRRSEVAIAQAQIDMAQKALADAQLVAPADGVISARMLKAGESVNVHEAVFHMVQVDQVLLVVGVPEAKIGAIVNRFRAVNAGQTDVAAQESDARDFRAYVKLIGKDSFGRDWEPITGTVKQISQTSDEQSGLFEVEIMLDNPQHLIRPGRIAVAHLVIRQVDAFRVPSSSAIIQDGELFLYTLRPESTSVRYLFWNLAEELEYFAQRFPLRAGNYVEQGDELIIFDLPEEHRLVVVRGQQRLLPDTPAMIANTVGPGGAGQPDLISSAGGVQR